ncbi:MAG: hypothetical protein JOZ22_26630 [Acidobacteriia bacterium]|nr:hypothetical protein [Terriglobia bacterium]
MNYVDIDDRLRLWSGILNRLPTPAAHQRDLLISAHGCPRLFNKSFKVPESTAIIFYGPEGEALIDPGFKDVLAGYVIAYEILGPAATCSDYSLIKYQGYRGTLAAAIFGKIAKPFVSGEGETYQDIENYLANLDAPLDMDMLTLHASPGKISLTFSKVLKTLIETGYSYKNIHCIFCRGITGGYKPEKIKPPTVFGLPRRTSAPLGEWDIVPPRPI